MTLPENPSGRDLAAFAGELRAAAAQIEPDVTEASLMSGLAPPSQLSAGYLLASARHLDCLAIEHFASEAREALKAEAAETTEEAEYEGSCRFPGGWIVSADPLLTIHYDGACKRIHVSQ